MTDELRAEHAVDAFAFDGKNLVAFYRTSAAEVLFTDMEPYPRILTQGLQ